MKGSVLLPVVAIGTVVVAVSTTKKRRKKKKRSSPSPKVDGGDVVVVPAPSEVEHAWFGGANSPAVGAYVQWWVAEYEGRFGWQYVDPETEVGEMSFEDGYIYHYATAEDAREALNEVLA